MYTSSDAKREALFSEAYREYREELMRHARAMLGSRELSEDVVQDVFVKMWVYLMRGGKISRTGAFLHRVLNNSIVDLYRKHKTVSLDALLEQGHEPGIDESERLINVLDGTKAFSLIDQLPDTYQHILRMKYARGLSYQEIVHLTRQSKNAIAVQAHRGLEKLRLLCSVA